jgi:glycosyltransferase involved in cell wall biosynthesis
MTERDPLVSVGLPVRNGGSCLEGTIRSILAQERDDLEVIISDNGSNDGTEDLCRALAQADDRVHYHRQPRNIGLFNNFRWVINRARGRYFRWIGHGDWLEPGYLDRSLERFATDDRLVVVTTQLSFIEPDGRAHTAPYRGRALASDRPVERFAEMLRLQNDDYRLLDPLYGLVLRAPIAAIPRRNMLQEDQVFAAKMALAGPWGHVPEVLAHRGWAYEPASDLARKLDVPAWQAPLATLLQCRELLDHLSTVPLSPADRRQAHRCVARLFLHRNGQRVHRKLDRIVAAARTTQAGERRGPNQEEENRCASC